MKIFFTILFSAFCVTLFGQAVNINLQGEDEICSGTSITLTANILGTPDSLRWRPAGGNFDPTSPVITASPQSNTTYIVDVYFDGLTVSDSIDIAVDEYYFPELNADTTVCQGDPVQLAAGVPSSPTIYDWSPGDGLSDSSSANPFATPEETVSYTLIATSENGFCADTGSVTVTVLPAFLEIHPEQDTVLQDTVFLCKDQSVNLFTESSTGGPGIVWSPADGLNQTTGGSVNAMPEQTTTYIAELTTPDGCVRSDTITVRIDSLPELDIVAVPPPLQPCNKYCEGTIITLFSEAVNEDAYPDIEYVWGPQNHPSFKDSMDILNTAIMATPDTILYTRVNKNNACESTDSILIVTIEPSIPLNVDDTTVCPGQAIQIMAEMPEDLSMIEWESTDPANLQYLSCTDCPNPVITIGSVGGTDVEGEFTFTVKATKEECCPAEGEVKITVEIREQEEVEVFTCPGLPVQLSLHDAVSSVLQWSPMDMLECNDDDCTDPTVTVEQTSVYTYTGLDTANCTVTGEASVIVYAEPQQEINAPDSVAIGSSVDAELIVSPPIPDPDGVVWMVNDETIDVNGLVVMLPVNDRGESIIKATYTDANGCIRMITTTIQAVEPMYAVPKAFTPNSDEINDFFRPVLQNKGVFEDNFITDFKVFNRWGEKVYDNDSNAEGWDGRQDGEDAPSDVYVYIIEITLPSGQVINFKGDVTLLR